MPIAQTFGRYLLNQELPSGYQISGEIGKREFKEEMNRLSREDPKKYVDIISKLKRLGDELATTEGLSIGLDDITPDYKGRDKILAPLERRFRSANTDTKRRAIVEEAQKKLVNHAMQHKGSLTLQVKSGARGNPTQYGVIVSGLGYARDPMNGKSVPWLIGKSYAEGLKPADYWAQTGQSVMDVIRTYTAISEPGELSKKLINTMSDLVVTEDDCGTSNGIFINPKSPDAIDRYIAKDTGPFKRNQLVTPMLQPKLARTGKRVLLRSPMTCETADGVCQKCQGLDEKGTSHPLGINVGVRAAQAMAEPLTQFALNAKHGGRTLESDKFQVHGISGFRQIIETPRQFVNKATLASKPGKITKIEEAPQGGYSVKVDEETHYVPPNLGLKVKRGQKVEAGDILSEGIPKPDEVVKYRGLAAGRQYMVDVLKNLYKGQGKDLDQRHFELLAKSGMNHVRIMNDPSGRFIKGDIVNYNNLRSELGKRVKEKPLKDALGSTLGKGYYDYAAGTRVTPSVIRRLQRHNVSSVTTAPRAPEVTFVMKPATSIPKLNPDWMARLSHQGLKASILQAAHTGEVANIHGTHPVPAYAYGVEFGEGPKGRY